MMTIPKAPSLLSTEDIAAAIAIRQRELQHLCAQRKAAIQAQLRSSISDVVTRLKTSGFNDEEIKSAFIEFFRITAPALKPILKQKFVTCDDQLCTNPKDTNVHWWTGKGGRTPHWAAAENLNTEFGVDQIRQIKLGQRSKTKR